jgi:hypothetical protein
MTTRSRGQKTSTRASPSLDTRHARGELSTGALHPARRRRPVTADVEQFQNLLRHTRVMQPTTSIVRDQERGSDAVWFYDQPYPVVAEIKGHVAFYTDRIDLTVSSPDRHED